MSHLLVTGGLGFVGSHFVWAAHRAGREVVVLDDGSAGTRPGLPDGVEVIAGDIADPAALAKAFGDNRVGAIVHFAGLIQVGESVRRPEAYFDVNLVRALAMLEAARRAGVRELCFSSTAAVYGEPEKAPIPEDAAKRPLNPYGASKLSFEYALAGYERAHGLRWAALRYFNAAGADATGRLREAHEPETHLIPLVIDAALGRRGPLMVFGTDYPTADGTCVRDYIHVSDLADAHLLALDRLRAGEVLGPMNLGSGQGHSVREVIEVAARIVGAPVPHDFGARRDGDPAVLVADPARAKQVLGWSPKRSELATIVDDALRSRR